MRKRVLLPILGLPIGFALLIGAEGFLAVMGEDLPEQDPYRLNRTFGDSSANRVEIAWIGNSISAGKGASSPDTTVPHLVAQRLGFPIDLNVLAVSGARVADALNLQMRELEETDARPDVVIIEIGANDVTHLTGGTAFRRDLDTLLAEVQALEPAEVVVLGIPAFGTTPRFLQPLRLIAGWRSRKLDGQVRAAAEAHGAVYVDIAARTGPEFGRDPSRYYASDDFHPSDAGYALWADAVVDGLSGLDLGRAG